MFTSISAASFLAFGIPGGMGEWLLIAAVGLLLFGKRLPEVGRSLGKGIVEFKKGLKGVEDEIEEATDEKPKHQPTLPPTQDHKFDPYTGQPVANAATQGGAQHG